jgi:molybdopterin adenylyltransferase
MTSENPVVVSVNISDEKGTIKHPVPAITIDGSGVGGDAHAGTAGREVSLLAEESIERFAREIGRDIGYGEFAENITTRGVDLNAVGLLDRFRINGIELEVTQIGKECHGTTCAIFREVGRCVMPKEGIFCRVLSGGTARAGDTLTYTPKIMECRVITLSDRASRGEYADLSGPLIQERLEAFFGGARWRPHIERSVIPDEPASLLRELRTARDRGCDLIFTTGGTGIGPRDITPDVVAKECDKLIPGIMDFIRVKYGASHPTALLSRGVAGVLGTSLVFTLPGSVRAVDEYMREILKILEHLIAMLHGLPGHHQ